MENFKIFDERVQPKDGFKFELFDKSEKITEEQTAVWFEEVNWYTAGNCIIMESEFARVEKEWVRLNLYCTLVLSLSLLEIYNVAIRVGFYLIQREQQRDS